LTMEGSSMRGRLAELLALRALPPRVAWFRFRALRTASSIGDIRARREATPPHQVAAILRLARGRQTIVEIGTSAGWTTLALAIDNPTAKVTTYDPQDLEVRARYCALSRDAARRITFVTAVGEEPAGPDQPVDFLFIDANHRRESTRDTFRAWEDRLSPDAVVVFHDFTDDWPGVIEAIQDLDLAGRDESGMYVWRPGDGTRSTGSISSSRS